MIVSNLPVTTEYDSTCCTPIDIDGATYKTSIDHITPTVANNLTTTSSGYVLDARQGKVLSDAIASNTSDVSGETTIANTGYVVNAGAWTLYESRNTNDTIIYFPRTAKEVLISVSYYSQGLFNAIYLPGVFPTGTTWLVIGLNDTIASGSTTNSKTLYVPIVDASRAVFYVNNTSSSDNIKTQVWYR